MVGLVDCNNFFVSCERVFKPWLNGVPVVVLSNNDGCVIARSNEAKAMGIKMGVPFYQVRPLADSGKLTLFSSNYALYGDMSRRVMNIIRSMVPRIEVYSIDECFIHLEGIRNPQEYCREMVTRIRQCTGIPVSIGIAPSKTLAKMASKFAKKYKGYRGCCQIDTDEKRLKALSLFPIEDVWGIGRRSARKLQMSGVKTALDFSQWSEDMVKPRFGINGVRTWQELRGIASIPAETTAAKQTITTSRSFKECINSQSLMNEMVADFAAHCARKVREQHSRCTDVTVFLHTNAFREDAPQFFGAYTTTLHVASSDVRELVAAASKSLQALWRPGFDYKQAGVTVSNIVTGVMQTDAFDTVDRQKQERLLKTLDQIKSRHGERALRVMAQGDCSNEINRNFRSPCYTTDLAHILEVRTDG